MRRGVPVRNHFVGVNKMVGAQHSRTHSLSPRWGLGYFVSVRTQGDALGYRVDAPLARKSRRTRGAIFVISPRTNEVTTMMSPRTKGAKPASPGHRPGNASAFKLSSPEGAEPQYIAHRVSPRWGLGYFVWVRTQGDALGYRVDAPLARKNPRTKGAKPVSPGQRPGFIAPPPISSPERAGLINEARELEARIAENVVELLEA